MFLNFLGCLFVGDRYHCTCNSWEFSHYKFYSNKFDIPALFIYTCGAVIIMEDLGSGKQNFLMGKEYHFSTSNSL